MGTDALHAGASASASESALAKDEPSGVAEG